MHPPARRRDTGPSGSGVSHFWHQRVSAIALLLLFLVDVVLLGQSLGLSRAEARAVLGRPLPVIALCLTIIAGFWHAKLGVETVIEDYVHHEGRKLALMITSTLLLVFAATASLLAVMHIALGE